MKRRYITFYKFRLCPIPHFKTYGMVSTDRWISCMKYGIRLMFKGEITFFVFHTPDNGHNLTYRK
jgi:hypothetical protein